MVYCKTVYSRALSSLLQMPYIVPSLLICCTNSIRLTSPQFNTMIRYSSCEAVQRLISSIVDLTSVQVLRDFTHSIFCCTEAEAARLGRFLYETLSLIHHWKSSRDVYMKVIFSLPTLLYSSCSNTLYQECTPYRGFSASFKTSEQISYEDFLKCAHKWHCKMGKVIARTTGHLTRLLYLRQELN